MRIFLAGVALGVVLLHADASGAQQSSSSLPARGVSAHPVSEEAWIVSDITSAITRLTRCAAGTKAAPAGAIADHVWAPERYRPLAERCLPSRPQSSGSDDIDVRTPLAEMSPDALIEQSRRVGTLLAAGKTAGSAHESAALIVGAFALREAQGWFTDHRPAISRMTAHLAIARALRGGTAETPDGRLARIILTTLVGRQRDALSLLTPFESANTRPVDRAWSRALRLRITGDWRKTPADKDLLRVERLEHGRAIRERLGIDALLDYLDDTHDTEIDWQRIAFFDDLSLEAGHRLAKNSIDGELAEAANVMLQLRSMGTAPSNAELIAHISAPAVSSDSGQHQILDWPMWAGQLQRHLGHAMIATGYAATNDRGDNARSELLSEWRQVYGSLPSFPVVHRWLATNVEELDAALAGARVLVARSPQLVTAQQWAQFLEKPEFLTMPRAFPVSNAWFNPKVPTGTAFDLTARALIANSPVQPAKEQAARWAYERPYDSWVIWSDAWIAVDAQPSVTALRSAFGPMLEYDTQPLKNMVDHLSMPPPDRMLFAAKMCELARDTCDRLAELQLLNNREPDALETYDKWATSARDTVQVANTLTWMVRRHYALGNHKRALELAALGAETYASRGIEIFAEVLERAGRIDDAETLYRAIIERYPENRAPLGAFLMRQAARHQNPDTREAFGLFRPLFPEGLELLTPARESSPAAGVGFSTFGPRAASFGLEQTDMIVAVDGWRVRTARQYSAAMRLSNDDAVKLTVWRNNRYVDLQTTIPQRWVGVRFIDVARAER